MRKGKREWIRWIAESMKETKQIGAMCSVIDCDNDPTFIVIANYIYFVCDDCRELLEMERKYSAKDIGRPNPIE